MTEGTIGLIIIALFIAVLLFGFLFGLWRGMNKSLVRLLLVVASIVGAFFIAPLLTKWVLTLDVSGLGINVGGHTVTTIGQFLRDLLQDVPYIADLNGPALERVLTVVPQMIANIVLFVLVFYIIRLISMIIYWIVAGIAFSKKKTEGKNKHRLIGSVVGVVQNFAIFLVLLVPVAGIVNIMGTVETIVTEEQQRQEAETASYTTLGDKDYVVGVTAEAEAEEHQTASLTDAIPENVVKFYNTINDVIRIYKNTWVAKFISGVKLDVVCQGVFDKLSTIDYNGEKYELKTEVKAGAKLLTDFNHLQEYDASKFAERDLREWLKTEKHMTDQTQIDALVDYAIAGTEETGETEEQKEAREKYANLVERYNSDKIQLQYKVLIAQSAINHAYEGKLIGVTIDQIVPEVAAKLLLDPSDPDYGPVFGIYLDDILGSVDESYKIVVKRLLAEIADTTVSLQSKLDSSTDMVATLLGTAYDMEKAMADIGEATISGETAKELLEALATNETIDLAKDILLNEVEEGEKNNLEKIADEIFGEGENQVKDVVIEVVTEVIGSDKYESGEADIKDEIAVVGSALDLAQELMTGEPTAQDVQKAVEQVVEDLSKSVVILDELDSTSSALKDMINEHIDEAAATEELEEIKDWISGAIAQTAENPDVSPETVAKLYDIFGITPPSGD